MTRPDPPRLDDVIADFDVRAASYARNRWHLAVAERLVALCDPQAGVRALDAATGTGFAALAMARRVGGTGQVVGVDVSAAMLQQARGAAASSGIANVEWHQADATRLPASWAGTFDLVTCAAGLLYMDPVTALGEWRRVLVPGGLVAFSSMRAGSPPAGALFRACAEVFGVLLADSNAALGSAAACRDVLERTGYSAIAVVEETVTLSMDDLELAWESNLRSAGHRAVRSLNPVTLEVLRRAYLEAVAAAARDQPDDIATAGVLYALGRRSLSP